MRSCKACGAVNADTHRFCSQCGSTLESSVQSSKTTSGYVAPGENSDAPTHKRSHRANEENLTRPGECSACNRLIEPGARFCIGCGEPLLQLPKITSEVAVQAEENPPGQDSQADPGFIGALFGSSIGCGCGCFSITLFIAALVLIGVLI